MNSDLEKSIRQSENILTISGYNLAIQLGMPEFDFEDDIEILLNEETLRNWPERVWRELSNLYLGLSEIDDFSLFEKLKKINSKFITFSIDGLHSNILDESIDIFGSLSQLKCIDCHSIRILDCDDLYELSSGDISYCNECLGLEFPNIHISEYETDQYLLAEELIHNLNKNDTVLLLGIEENNLLLELLNLLGKKCIDILLIDSNPSLIWNNYVNKIIYETPEIALR